MRKKLLAAACVIVCIWLVTHALGTLSDLQVSRDPYGGVPACTDQIADAGGVCHGEP